MCKCHSLVEKTCLYFEAVFNFSGGIEILPFCWRGGIHGRKYIPVLFQEWYDWFLVQFECSVCWKIILSYFDAPRVHLSCYCGGKAKTTEMSFASSIGPSHPISEIGTSHTHRIKTTRNKGDRKLHVLLIKRVRTQCSIFWVSSAGVAAVR